MYTLCSRKAVKYILFSTFGLMHSQKILKGPHSISRRCNGFTQIWVTLFIMYLHARVCAYPKYMIIFVQGVFSFMTKLSFNQYFSLRASFPFRRMGLPLKEKNKVLISTTAHSALYRDKHSWNQRSKNLGQNFWNLYLLIEGSQCDAS